MFFRGQLSLNGRFWLNFYQGSHLAGNKMSYFWRGYWYDDGWVVYLKVDAVLGSTRLLMANLTYHLGWNSERCAPKGIEKLYYLTVFLWNLWIHLD